MPALHTLHDFKILKPLSNHNEKHMTKYKIVRQFFNTNRKLTVKTNVSLKEAQAHCHNPQTSSTTCTDKNGKERTKRYGRWFDQFTEQR